MCGKKRCHSIPKSIGNKWNGSTLPFLSTMQKIHIKTEQKRKKQERKFVKKYRKKINFMKETCAHIAKEGKKERKKVSEYT